MTADLPITRLPFPPNQLLVITPRDSLPEAIRKSMLGQFQVMLSHEQAARLGGDSEGVHQMRVATRRIRSMYKAFGNLLDDTFTQELPRHLKHTARTLGPVRDLDVFAENTRQYIKIARVRNSPAMNALLTVLDEQHQAAHRNLIDWLDSDEYLRFVFAFFDVLKVKATTNHLPKSELLTTPISYEVRHVLPALIQEQFRAVRQYEILLPCTDVRTLHRLRIHDKKLRYSLEAFRVVLGRPANDVIRQVKMLQSYLGDMNDASVAANRLVELRTQHPALDDSAIEAYRVYCATRCERYVAGFPRVWAKFNQQRLRRSLGRALANC